MERSAIKHYMNESFAYKLKDKQYVIKLITKKNDLKEVNIIYVEKYLREREVPSHIEHKIKMHKVASTSICDYYEAIIDGETTLNNVRFTMLACRYCFELISEDEILYYGNYKYFKELPHYTIDFFNLVIHQLDASYFDTPSWAKGATFYQIFPERFYPTDGKYSSSWNQVPMHWKTRTNGTLKGVYQKLDYIKDLGVDAIYFNPIFKAHTSHRYDIEDYMEIDPLLGTKEDFALLVKEAHKKGIKIVLDIVFNHSSIMFPPFQDVLKNQEKSKYKDWYFIKEFPVDTEFPAKYMGFSFSPYMPKLNTDNKECREYLLNVVRYYLEEFDVDGYRLDVADEVTHSFWKEFRQVCKSIKKDCLIMGEVWYESSPYLRGDEFDSIMNYTFFDAIRNVLVSKYTLEEFADYINRERGESCLTYFHTSNTLIGSHDTDRVFTFFNKDIKKFLCAYTLLYFLPGAPLIYYGDEIAMEGGQDPDCRRGMIFIKNYNTDILSLIKNLISLKHTSLLKEGDIRFNNTKSYLSVSRYDENDEITLIIPFEKEEEFPLYKGLINLFNNTIFNGKLKPFEILIIRSKKDDEF